jgi:hypothetical protein
MRVQLCWRNFTQLRARQSFYRLADALMSVVIANFNNITARCSWYCMVQYQYVLYIYTADVT